MMRNSETEFKAELLRLLLEIEKKAEQVRDDNSFVYANYDPSEENKVWEQGKNAVLPLLQSNPLWAFEALFDYLHAKGYRHFYPLHIAEDFIKNSLPIQQEIISMLKQHLSESKFPFLKHVSLKMLGIILLHQSDKNLQSEVTGFLLDEDPLMRLTSLRIVEELRDESAIPLLSLLLDDSDSRVRSQSLMLLARFNTPASRVVLQEWRKQNPIV